MEIKELFFYSYETKIGTRLYNNASFSINWSKFSVIFFSFIYNSLVNIIIISLINKTQNLNALYFLRQIPWPPRHEQYVASIYPQNLALILIHLQNYRIQVKWKKKLKGNVELWDYPPNPLSLSVILALARVPIPFPTSNGAFISSNHSIFSFQFFFLSKI